MLDEFCAVTECYRKAAIRVLNSRPSGQGLNGAVASTTGPLAKSRLLQWSRGGAAAETYTSCDRIRLSSALQWSRGADAAETFLRTGAASTPARRFNGAAAPTPRRPAAIIPHDSISICSDERERYRRDRRPTSDTVEANHLLAGPEPRTPARYRSYCERVPRVCRRYTARQNHGGVSAHHRTTGPRSCTVIGRPTALMSWIGRAWEGPRSITST